MSAVKLWQDRGFEAGLFDACLRSALKLHREYLKKLRFATTEIEMGSSSQMSEPVEINSTGGSWCKEGNIWICLKNGRGVDIL